MVLARPAQFPCKGGVRFCEERVIRCREVTGTGSRMTFTYINRGGDGRPDIGRWTRLVLWILKTVGEPWLWSIRPAELGRFIEDAGWTNDRGLAGASSGHGVEFFGVATR